MNHFEFDAGIKDIAMAFLPYVLIVLLVIVIMSIVMLKGAKAPHDQN